MDPSLAPEYLALSRLQAGYGDAVTRRAWDELIPMFTADCPVRLDLRSGTMFEKRGGAEIGAFIAESIERFEFFMFTIVNAFTTVEPGGAEAQARVYIRELRQDRDEQTWSTAYGLYRDFYRKSADGWQFAARDYASLARTAPDGDGMLVFDIPR